MIPYIGCEYAREHLDAFVDGELSVDEQVAVESHLRWCRTCAARVEDVQLIGDSIRLGSLAPRAIDDDARVVSDLHSSVLIRVRAEEELSLGSRVPRDVHRHAFAVAGARGDGGGHHLSWPRVERASARVDRAAGVAGQRCSTRSPIQAPSGTR